MHYEPGWKARSPKGCDVLLSGAAAIGAWPTGSSTFTLTRLTLIGLVTGTVDLAAGIADGTVRVDGDPAALQRLVHLLAPVDPNFPIVTP
jgi:alkyl sulfatase BDS1-like metallo-beta-lactamase superfamily hydrolase